jgi:glycosyltransferase involved in cell wall biosynthesis
MLESMAAGAHVIGSATAPVKELLQDGVNGTLVDFFDVKGWSTALIDALAHPEAYADRRRAARQTILEGYDLQSICLPQMVDYVESFGPK